MQREAGGQHGSPAQWYPGCLPRYVGPAALCPGLHWSRPASQAATWRPQGGGVRNKVLRQDREERQHRGILLSNAFLRFSPCVRRSVRPRVSLCGLLSPPARRSLLLAAEWQEPADHQPPPDQRGLGHPVPHRHRLLPVQLRREDLLHQGGEEQRGFEMSSCCIAAQCSPVLRGHIARFIE